jgi:hypothetical protein
MSDLGESVEVTMSDLIARMDQMQNRMDQLVRVVRFGLGGLLESLEDPAGEELVDLTAL